MGRYGEKKLDEKTKKMGKTRTEKTEKNETKLRKTEKK